jgi:adhesin transport system outer membrane protein
VLISAQPLYSNAKDPEFGLVAQPSVLFQSPQFLQRLLQQVTQAHPLVKSQIQTMQSAGLDILIAQQAYWPTPSVAMERVQSQSPDPAYAGGPQVLTLRLQQPLWTGGRLTAQSDKALANQNIERARLEEIQQSLALKTLQAWAEVVSAQRQQSALLRSEEIQAQLRNKMARRVAQGISSHSEAHYAGLRLQQVQQELRNAQQQENLAWIRLKQWVPEAQMATESAGIQNEPSPASQAADLAQALSRMDVSQWETLSLARSAVIRRLNGVLQFQVAELAEKRAALQPEVYVRAEHQRGNYAYANLPPINRLFVGLSASTGAGLSLGHQLASIQAKRDGTLEELAAAQRNVMEAIQTDYVNASARQSKAADLRLNLESSQELQAAWERQFSNGKKTWIDVMNAARESSQAELAWIDNEMAMLQSYWRLQIQAHGPDLKLTP